MRAYEEFARFIEENNIKKAAKSRESLKETEEYIYGLTDAKMLIEEGKINEAEQLLSHKLIIKSSEKRKEYHAIQGILLAEVKVRKGKINDAERDLKQLKEEFQNYTIIDKALNKLNRSQIKHAPDEEDIKETFLKLYRENAEIKPGSDWYAIDADWIAKFKAYIGLECEQKYQYLPFNALYDENLSSSLPVIENSSIIDCKMNDQIITDEKSPSFYSLKPGLTENLDYVLIPQPVFTLLHTKYTFKQIIKRTAIQISESQQIIEVYMKRLRIAFLQKQTLTFKLHNSSRKAKISEICAVVLNHLDIKFKKLEFDKVQVWKFDNDTISEELMKSTLQVGGFDRKSKGIQQLDLNITIDDAEITESASIFIDFSLKSEFKIKAPVSSDQQCKICHKNPISHHCQYCKLGFCSNSCLTKHKSEVSICRPRRRRFTLFSCFCTKDNSDTEDPIPQPSKFNKGSSLASSVSSTTSTTPTNSYSASIIGLQNLGNTCFMNSAIQCLASCEPLSRFFLTNDISKRINKSNPLGSKGKLALAYAELLHSMRGGKERSIAPWALKKTISVIATQFEGYQQHDSHEFLCYLVSGLHEDLNEIIKKPYDSSDIKYTNDQEVADESWRRHCFRNKSIIIDLLYGQYKSTLHCPKCQKYSYAFDPFNCITLPIPYEAKKRIDVNFVPYDWGEELSQISVMLEAKATVADIKQELAKKFNKDVSCLKAIECKMKFPMQIQKDSLLVDNLRQNNMNFYELPADFEAWAVIGISSESSSSEFYYRFMGIEKNQTMNDLLQSISEYLKPLVSALSQGKNTDLQYNVFANANQLVKCFICEQPRCSKQCRVQPSNEKLKNALTKDSYLYLKVVFGNELRKCDTSRYIKFSRLKSEDKSTAGSLSIYDCFTAFSTPEMLDKNNSWYCPLCKTHVQANKKLELYRIPPILTIHLKRFKTSGYYRDKINIPIDFPRENLDISRFVIGQHPALYDLFAVSNHFGTLSGGHYTATVLNESKGKWYECNDSQVTDSREISETASYVLFYKAKNSYKNS